MSKRTYGVTVEIDRDDELGDRAVVTILGHRFRYPYHWEDNLKSLARRAVTDNFHVAYVDTVEVNSRGRVPRGSFHVTAVL